MESWILVLVQCNKPYGLYFHSHMPSQPYLQIQLKLLLLLIEIKQIYERYINMESLQGFKKCVKSISYHEIYVFKAKCRVFLAPTKIAILMRIQCLSISLHLNTRLLCFLKKKHYCKCFCMEYNYPKCMHCGRGRGWLAG